MTTLQDKGRRGLKKDGIPQSGPIDWHAFEGGNLLLKNERGALGLEFTFPAPKLLSLRDAVVALTGGDFSPYCDGSPVPIGEAFFIAKGSILHFKSLRKGRWSYLLIAGGFMCKKVLGSSSTYLKGTFGGQEGRSLKKGDILYSSEGVRDTSLLGRRFSSFKSFSHGRAIRVLPGPQFHHFSLRGIETFFNSEYQLGKRWDRMGYILEGPRIEAVNSNQCISQGLTPGAIQILGDGRPVVMMADAQTIGGYKKIGWVLRRDLPILAQLMEGEKITFVKVTRAEAMGSLEGENHWLAKGEAFSLRFWIRDQELMVDLEELEE